MEIKAILGFCSLKDVLEVFLLPLTLSLIAPWVTYLWQNRQRDLNIKTELVAEIVGLVMTTVMTVFIFNTRNGQAAMTDNNQEHELDQVYKKWRTDSCVIGSKLHAYFSDKEKDDMQVHKKWEKFSNQLTKYYEDLSDKNSRKSVDDLNEKKEDLFEGKAKIIEEILASKITGFRASGLALAP